MYHLSTHAKLISYVIMSQYAYVYVCIFVNRNCNAHRGKLLKGAIDAKGMIHYIDYILYTIYYMLYICHYLFPCLSVLYPFIYIPLFTFNTRILYHTMLHHTMLHHTIPYHTIPYHTNCIGYTAYACQCSWRAVNSRTTVKSQSNLKWVCTGQKC